MGKPVVKERNLLDYSYIPLSYEQVFGEKPESILTYIRPLGKERVIQACVRCAEHDIIDQQDDLLSFLPAFMRHVCEKYIDNLTLPMFEQYTQQHKYILIQKTTLYDILEQALTLNDECEPFDDTDNLSEELFFKALLAANSAYLEKQNNIHKNDDGKLSQERLFKTMLANMLSYDSFTSKDPGFTMLTQVVKSTLFLQYMEENYPEHIAKLMEEYGCDDWREYQRELSGLALQFLNNGSKDMPAQISAEEGSLLQRILLRNSVSKLDHIDENTDHRYLRERPVYPVSNTLFVILSWLFLIERLYNGLIFDLNAINKKVARPIPEFFAEKGSRFSEERLFYKLLDEIFKKKSGVKKSGKEMREAGITGEPDYYVRSGNKVFLFESKDVMCPAKIRNSNDPEKISAFLYDKFVQQDNGKPKAIKQLVNNMQLVDSGTLDSEAKNVRVYPILVVHDYIYDTIGVNYQLIKWFRTEVESRQWSGRIKRICPVIILPIDTLIMLEKALTRTSVKLDKLLEEYVRKYVEVEDCNTWISFSQYLWRMYGDNHGFAPIIEKTYMSLWGE